MTSSTGEMLPSSDYLFDGSSLIQTKFDWSKHT
jgi:hypothetical protein